MNNPAKIAACNICTLAKCMKDCKNCPLNPSKLKLNKEEQSAVLRKELLKA